MATDYELKKLSFNNIGIKKRCIDLILQDRNIPIPTIPHLPLAAIIRVPQNILMRCPDYFADLFGGWEYGN